MSRFEDDLRRAARGKRNTAILASLAIMVFGLVLAGYFLSFRSLSITVKPRTAQKSAIIEVSAGAAFAITNRIYALSDAVQLSISANKYQTADRNIDNTNFGSEMTVTLLPKPGTLHATVKP